MQTYSLTAFAVSGTLLAEVSGTIDGSKFKAVNIRDKNFTRAT